MHTRNPHMARAELLIGQNRYDLAEPELRLALSDDPNDPMAHAHLAVCLRERESFTEATQEAQAAIGLAPDDAEPHYVLSSIYSERHMPREALTSALEAIRLDPGESRYWARLAFEHSIAKRWRESLEAAEKGLALDPEDPGCVHARAVALRGLGRKEESGDAVAGALARNPESAVGHANMGWNLLHQSKPKQALVHFREALRLQPDMEWARLGIVEALKARWLPYRLILRYFLFMSRLSGRRQWYVIIGGYVGYQIIRTIAKNNPTLAPYLWPIVGLYLAFVVSTWLAVPLFNLVLRFSRFGRHVLSRNETISANLFGVSLLLPTLAAAIWLNTDRDAWLVAALLMLPQIVAVAMTAYGRKGRGRVIRWCWAGLVALPTVVLVVAELLVPQTYKVVHNLIFLAGLGVLLMGIGSVWVSNIAATIPEKRRD